MIIFRDYTTDELVMNLPCDIGNGIKVYPTLVKDYKRFQNYTKYVVFNKKHLQIAKEMPLLQELLLTIIASNSGVGLDVMSPKFVEAMNLVLNDFCDFLSLTLRTNMHKEKSPNGHFYFANDDGKIIIDDKNFSIFRLVVLKMNMLREVKIYERDIDRIWEEKALIARSKKNKKIELGEMLTIVRNVTHEKYEDLLEMNVFQFYCDYFRIQQVVGHNDTTLFATVSEKAKPSDFIDGVVELLYRDPTKDLNVKNDFRQYV